MGTYLNGKKGNKKRTYKGSNLNMTKQKKNDVIVMNFRRGGYRNREEGYTSNFMNAGAGYIGMEATTAGTVEGRKGRDRGEIIEATGDVSAGIDKSQFAGATQGDNGAEFNSAMAEYDQTFDPNGNVIKQRGGKMYLNKQRGGSLGDYSDQEAVMDRMGRFQSESDIANSQAMNKQYENRGAMNSFNAQPQQGYGDNSFSTGLEQNQRRGAFRKGGIIGYQEGTSNLKGVPSKEFLFKRAYDQSHTEEGVGGNTNKLTAIRNYEIAKANNTAPVRDPRDTPENRRMANKDSAPMIQRSKPYAEMDDREQWNNISKQKRRNTQAGDINDVSPRAAQEMYLKNLMEKTGSTYNTMQKGGNMGFQDGGDYEEFINSDRVSKGYQKYAKRKEAKKQRYLNDYIEPQVLPEDVEELYFGDPTVTEYKDSDYKKELDKENKEWSSKNTMDTDMHSIRDKHSPKTKTQKAIDASNASANDGFVEQARWKSQKPYATDDSIPEEYVTPSEVDEEIIDDGIPIDSKAKKTLKSLGRSASTVYTKGKEGVSEMNKDGRLANDIIGNIGRFEDVRAGREAIRKMRDLETPYADVQGIPKLKSANFDAARRGVDDQIRSSNKTQNSMIGNSAARQALKASGIGSGIKAKGDLWDKEHRLNAQIKNQQASMAAQITGRNIANKLEGDKREFMKQADLIAMKQENRKTKGAKFEAIARDVNLKKDKRLSNNMELASSDPRTAKLLSNKMDEQQWFDAYGTTKADYFNMTPAEQAEQVKQYQAIQATKDSRQKYVSDGKGGFKKIRKGGVLNTLKSAGYFK